MMVFPCTMVNLECCLYQLRIKRLPLEEDLPFNREELKRKKNEKKKIKATTWKIMI